MTKIPTKEWKGVRLYRGDSLKVLRSIPDLSAHLTLTDPPYNVGFSYDSLDDSREDYEDWCADWLFQCERITDGLVCFSPGHVNVAMWCKIKQPRWIMCWWKPAAMGRSLLGFCNWEPMLVYGNRPRKRNQTDVIRGVITAKESLKWHPCPKPLEWGVKFVKALSLPGDVVLDPFFGSGTVGVACVQTGRKFVGIELSDNYFCKAADRIYSAKKQNCFFET